MNRREFFERSLAATLLGSRASTVEANAGRQEASKQMPHYYVAGYDTEMPECLPGVEILVKLHKRYRIPATFFFVGRILEVDANRYVRLMDDELFDIQSHTFSHSARPDRNFQEWSLDLVRGIESVRRVFGHRPLGLRLPGGYFRGFQGQPDWLAELRRLGFRFISADSRGPDSSMPAPLTQPYWYEVDGYSDLLELPANDWQDDELIGATPDGAGAHPGSGVIAWPPVLPTGIPTHLPRSHTDVADVYKRSLEFVTSNAVSYYSPIFHPWALFQFDPELKAIDSILNHALNRGMTFRTYRSMYKELEGTRVETRPRASLSIGQ